jgi:ubiquinone/menaquinone biosynthesis C-methylase UbiE
MDAGPPQNQAEHNRRTREAYDRLSTVWAATTDDGPFNGHLERPALRSLVPQPLTGRSVLDAGCGSGAQCEWLADHGAQVTGVDLSPAMVVETERRCGGRGRYLVADLAEPLPLPPSSFDGITCSLTLHYLEDWSTPLRSFASLLRPGGWVVLSVDHPFADPLSGQRQGYFAPELVADTWQKGDVEVTQHFWRRPLSSVVDAFAEAGFVVDRLVEARPTPEGLDRYPEELGPLAEATTFIVYRLLLRDAGASSSPPSAEMVA